MTINTKKLKNEWEKKFYPEKKHYLPDIKLSKTVWITDPCYERWTRCQGKINNLIPGTYTPVVEYNKEWRVKSLMIFKVWTTNHKFKALPFDIWVDCGIFCDSIYPKWESTWEYWEPGFYNDCCEATLGKWYDDSQEAYQCIHTIESIQLSISKWRDVFWKEYIDQTLEQFANLMNTWQPYYQAWVIQNKWVVSSSGRGDWSYTAYLSKNNDAILIRYI